MVSWFQGWQCDWHAMARDGMARICKWVNSSPGFSFRRNVSIINCSWMIGDPACMARHNNLHFLSIFFYFFFWLTDCTQKACKRSSILGINWPCRRNDYTRIHKKKMITCRDVSCHRLPIVAHLILSPAICFIACIYSAYTKLLLR